ncbi:MAG: hypothetical protein ACXACU_10820, partial [Candidatus Hodarchaeales archaeon]
MSSSSESSKLRKYGLEYIQDLAKDRKLAMQSLGVALSSFKSRMKQSNIATRREEREYIDESLKSLDKEARRTVENQLTQITLKSLKWIKNILIRDERIVIKEESKDEELVNSLQEKVETLSSEIQQWRQSNQSLESQIRSKEVEIQDIDRNYTRINEELQQQLTIERSRMDSLNTQVSTNQETIQDLQKQLEAKINQFTLLQEQSEATNLILIDKKAEISRLNSELKSINESLDATSQDAMAVWAQSYQELEHSHQETLIRVKNEYEEMLNNRLEENNESHQKELNQLTQKIQEEKNLLNTEINELKIKNQDLSDKFNQIDSEHTTLTQQKNEYLNELADNKNRIELFEKELEEIKTQKEEIYEESVVEFKQSVNKLTNVNEYIDT